MNRESITPKDKNDWLALRTLDITSTEIAALFGCNPYMTEFELWHRKKNKEVVKLDTNERMKWGTRLEDSIAAGIAEDNDWMVHNLKEYIRIPDLRVGSSFDFYKEEEPKPYEFIRTALLEIKNVDSLAFRDGWIVDGNEVEAPPHIELQVQHQLLVSGLPKAYIGALVGGNRVYLLERDVDPAVAEAIQVHAAKFWKSIDDNTPPDPDFNKDAEFIAKLMGYAKPGSILDAKDNTDIGSLAAEYRELGAKEKDIKATKNAIKAKLLQKIGEAEKVLGEKFTISSGMVGPSHVEYDREGYRSFRIHWRKDDKSKE